MSLQVWWHAPLEIAHAKFGVRFGGTWSCKIGNKTYNAILVGIVQFAVSLHANNAQAAIALCDADAKGTLRFQVFE